MGDVAKLTTCMIVSDYNPEHYNWLEKELSALGNCKATAEVIKRHLEDNGLKVKEMYAIEHKGEKKTDSQSKEHHRAVDETQIHYHIVAKFEPDHGATLKEIAKCISVPLEVIEKPKSGGHSYDNMLSYLTHIKYENKIQYAPEDVMTLAGTDYMDYYNERKERWIKARAIVAEKCGKTLKSLLREVMAKMEKGEIAYEELRGIKEYRKLLFEPTYARQMERKNKCIVEVAQQDCKALLDKIRKNEITSLNEIITNMNWNLTYKYHESEIVKELKDQLWRNSL